VKFLVGKQFVLVNMSSKKKVNTN